MTHQGLSIGSYLVYLEETDSTNEALRLLHNSKSIPEGTVLHSSYQTRGKGQQGNYWESDAGSNLLMSVLLRPSFLKAEQQVWVNLMVCLALRDAVANLGAGGALIKWPNDIFLGGRKVAGILIENSLQGNKIKTSIVGIGLNLNQQEFKNERAASLSHFTGRPIDLKLAREAVCAALTKYYIRLRNHQEISLLEEYHRYLLGKGIVSRFRAAGEEFQAQVMGIDNLGRLHLLIGDDVRSFAHKEVEYLGF